MRENTMRPSRNNRTPRKAMGKLKSSVKDPIAVYCRIRPLDDEMDQVCIKAKDDKTVILVPPEVSQNSRTIKETHYSFKHVFDDSTTQKELFDHSCLPLVQDLLQGSNGLLFTYGITSSGKTYTMTGTPQDGGLLPRSLDVIFNSIQDYQAPKFVFKQDKLNGFEIQSTAEALLDQQKELGIFNRNPRSRNKKDVIGDWSSRVPDKSVVEEILPDVNFSVFISYVEIYNNYIYDLLDDTPIDPKKTKSLNSKMLREDQAHNMYVFGVTENEVKNVDEALELFYKGQLRRRVSHTALNTESSRSHSVFTIRVAQAPLDPRGAEIIQDRDKVTISQFSLVDLAGSERLVRTKNTGQKLKDAGHINASLMALRNCIEILREVQTQAASKMVPYRETKLTHLFKTFFEGEGKIRMIVCVNPRADDYDETTHVMKFAEMTQNVLISRATPISTPNILGLRAGRGTAYREATKKAREQGVAVEDILGPTVYSLGPDFPTLIVHNSEDESVYINLIEFLSARIAKRDTFCQDLIKRQDDFRRNLITVDKEVVQLKQENTILQMDLDAREQQVRGLERKLSATEETLDILQKQVSDFKHQADRATSEANDRERLLSEQSREVDRMKTKMQEKIASEKDRLRRIMERRLAEKQAELERKMCFTDEKFRQLREILNADDDWEYFGDFNVQLPSVPTTASSSETSVPQTRRTRQTSQGDTVPETRFQKARSAVDFVLGSNASSQVPSTSVKHVADSIFFKENRPPNSQGTRSVAVSNPRHRRSTSTGAVWIEHKPVGNLDLNTVLQPAMKKKKSVSKLEVNDVTNSNVSKYVLQHQEQDSRGELETQLFKGDVIPSAGGGAQIIFNDVETLRQVSPPPTYNLRKRSGDNLPLRDIEDRCTVSVECHGLPSKISRKK